MKNNNQKKIKSSFLININDIKIIEAKNGEISKIKMKRKGIYKGKKYNRDIIKIQ